jgi:hypothetical protein
MIIRLRLLGVLLALGWGTLALAFGGCDGPAPAENLYSIPNALLREYDFSAHGLVRIHDYGPGSLTQLASPRGLPPSVAGRIRVADDPAVLSYRGFSARFNPAVPPPSSTYPEGAYLLALFGPLDLGVRPTVEPIGLRVLDSANPYRLLVKAVGGSIMGALTWVS